VSGNNLTPFERGNGAAVKHGAYSMMRLNPRAAQLADELRELCPSYASSDEPAIAVLGVALAQVEVANLVLSEATNRRVKRLREGKRETASERDELRRLTSDCRGWINSCRRLLGDLGLNPTSRAALARDLAAGARGGALAEYLEATYVVVDDADEN
jgi:hypothetical protein